MTVDDAVQEAEREVALAALPGRPPAARPRPVVLDGDPGQDDALAVLLACASQILDVLALTTHDCLGAPLAKVEFDILFLRMITDLPTMEIVREPHWKPRLILRGLDVLAVRI